MQKSVEKYNQSSHPCARNWSCKSKSAIWKVSEKEANNPWPFLEVPYPHFEDAVGKSWNSNHGLSVILGRIESNLPIHSYTPICKPWLNILDQTCQ